ncbi:MULTISPECIES: sigma-54 dependent transcriptional regulator [unclassified Azospirillum]|uniref:sigma-54-dependent transcriptional regulator n=1 Tax=unclassified Azospirillum TaxID=2630922 RepID=UPI000B70EAA4|nr:MULTISPECIES: sigma-54 dependent transcriptional regulator [unclassified Azospirillum]SNS13772.1 two-component system, NtrC family, response regulator [Azospirillum sp. RU38E]SNS30923.1 two-component system, NtrC family, response regulator [Azospirillum sp. RU37A]
MILIVDDETRLGEVTAAGLQARGFEAHAVDNVPAALAFLDENNVRLVLSDLRMPGASGRDLLNRLQAARPELPVIIMTAYASVRDAVALIREGAFDYIAKPFEMDDVVATISRALKLRDAEDDNRRLRQELRDKFDFGSLIGTSAPFQQVLKQVTDVCDSRATVLLHGESGTGKELIARAIHDNSQRRDKPFVAVNCAAIPENLMESELFGHVKGAFTGAIAARDGRFSLANGGTLFLDEIGDMPLALQAKVLRAVQEQTFEMVGGTRSIKVDVRFIAASHRDLRKEVEKGSFREDLYYRLNVFPITVPALRDRPGDIPALAAHFLARHARFMSKKLTGFSKPALTAMEAYRWQGNIRELQNCIERAVIVAQGPMVEVGDLPPYLFEDRPRLASGAGAALPADLDAELARVEKEILTRALRECGGIQARAAERLGITERSLWHRVKKLGIRITRSTG